MYIISLAAVYSTTAEDGNLHPKEEVSVITELNPNVVDTKEDTTTFVNIDGEAMTENFEVDIDLQGFVTESIIGFEEILLNPVGDTTLETNDILEQTTTVKVPQSETAGPLEFQHFSSVPLSTLTEDDPGEDIVL